MFYDYVVKPIKFDELIDKIELALSRAERAKNPKEGA